MQYVDWSQNQWVSFEKKKKSSFQTSLNQISLLASMEEFLESDVEDKT